MFSISISINFFFALFTKFAGFLLSLRNHGALSQRGPLFVIVLWLSNALLACVWLRTSSTLDKFESGSIAVALHAIYTFSLLFSGRATFINRRTIDADVSNVLNVDRNENNN